MAQKQFKIGLSNTDKQNMAQDVYERVLALTFNEYDTTTEYEVGDFVVYNDQLYKCISATSGAWDSSKWQLATLNDLVTDIENAVAFVNDKANVDGNYPTMTVGVADQLSPYDESSGDDQDEPFSFQATGTGNGSQPDFSTGSIALMKEKQGNTVVVNQLLNAYTERTVAGAVVYTDNGDGTLTISGTANASDDFTFFQMTPILNHTYIVYCNKNVSLTVTVDGAKTEIHTGFFATTIITTIYNLFIGRNIVSGETYNETLRVCVFDLTQWFNGDIPQDILDHPDHFFRYYQGSLAYNEGELVNSNGRYVKCIGRNQWDEEWELGGIDTTTGQNVADNTRIRSKNYIKVIPNKTYYGYVGGQGYFYPRYYDANKNFIGVGTPAQEVRNSTFIVPSNACYMRWQTYDYGTTYNHDITISIYYEDETGYDQYYPYEVLTNNDTGTEALRSAGSVCDIKLPSGEITRKTIDVDLGSLTWVKGSSAFYVSGFASANGVKQPLSNEVLTILASINVVPKSEGSVSGNKSTYEIYISSSGALNYYPPYDTYADGAALKAALNGKHAIFELAEPTTEQGTPYSENLVIDDFGSMDFGGNNGVPQGNLIFYPVDYKAFVDTLYKYTDGAPSKIALKSDLASDKSELQGVDTQLLNAVGGTLRHLLANANSLNAKTQTGVVDLGTLSWYYSDSGYFYSYNLQSLAVEDGHTLCSNADLINSQSGAGDKIYIGYAKILYCFYSVTTDTTAFKNAMKGVLLAYEKASE